MDTMRAVKVLALATLGLVACDDPSVDVHITPLSGTEVDGSDLTDQLDTAEVTVSVIDPVSAGEALGPGRVASCDDVAFGRIPEGVLDGARRTSVTAGRGAQLSGVPRDGDKLFVVEARTRNGRRIGGGCTLEGPITTDTRVDVDLLIAPTVQVFGRQDTIEPSTVGLLLTAPWDPRLPVKRHPVAIDAHAAGMSSTESSRGNDLGQFLSRVLPPPDGAVWPVGPAQTLVRVAWAEDVVRIPAFRPWPQIASGGTEIKLAVGPTPTFSPRWSIRAGTDQVSPYRFAAALQEVPGAEILVVGYDRDQGQRQLRAVTFAAAGAEAVEFFGRKLVTILPNPTPGQPGMWRGLDDDGTPTGWGPADFEGAATQIHTIVDCNGQLDGANARLLVRHGSRPITAYRGPGARVLETDPINLVVAKLNANNEKLIGSACLTLDDGGSNPAVQVVLSRGGGLGTIARIVTREEDIAILPDASSVATFADPAPDGGVRWLAVGAAATITGPRATSYKLAQLPLMGTMLSAGFAAEGRIDTPIASVPTSIDVNDVDGDGNFDLVGALPTAIGSRLQVNLGQMVGGEPLSAVTAILRGGSRSGNPIVRFLDVDLRGPPELVVVTDDGIEVFCLGPDAGTASAPPEAARCEF